MKFTFWVLPLFVLFVFLSAVSTQAQQAKRGARKLTTEDTFFSIQKNFNDYWKPFNVSNDGYYLENGIRKKAPGWKQFRRWEWFWDNRIDPTTGRFPNKSAADFYKGRSYNKGDRSATGNWTSMGPSSTTGGYAGLGRLNCVAFRFGDNNTIYTGSPSGGLWKTTDGGSNWTVLTDQNAVLGVSDAIVISGTTTALDTVYIATGDRDGGSMWSLGGGQNNDNNSIGVLKSVDGGYTWSATGLTYTASQRRTINRMLVNPNDNNILYAATSVGLYKTSDAGVTWTQLVSTVFIDIKYKPGDVQLIYGSTRNGEIHRSTNGGTSFSTVFDNSSGYRVDLAVSADEPTRVYAIVVNSSGGLYGIYKSTNSGSSFAVAYNGPNLLAWDCTGGDSGGQGGYDLAIAADPNNADIVFIGGVNTWKSTDGGSTWNVSNHWTGSCGVSAVHADQHFLAFQNGTSVLFECNDGGLYKTTNSGSSWSHIGNGLVISQIYRLGVAQTVSDDVIIGLQDNGTKALLSGTWDDVIGGDGMECIIDYTNENIQYGELYYGDLKRTTNHWSSYSTITSGLTGTAWWVMPFVIDPNVNTTLYAGKQDVFKSTSQGSSWTKISSWNGSTLRSMAVAPSNSNYIYTATQTILYRTTDGGSSWTNITGTLPTGSSYITYVSVKDDDPNTVWVSMGQYNSYGVFQTTDGGASWTNISTGMPGIPVMCVTQNKLNTSQIELYAGTDVGVYVKVGSSNWSLFSTNLPNVVVNELEIYYNTGTPSLSRIRAATSGRGLWESDLYTPPNQPPTADFFANITNPGLSQTVVLTDASTNVPATWLWSFTPSTVSFVGGTNASSQNPQLQFNVVDDYTVQLTSTNAYGNDVENKIDYITVSTLQTYCEASGGGTDEHITGVQFGTINNMGTGNDFYHDYTSFSTDLTINQLYSITITNGNVWSLDDLGVWIDWNHDGDFTDTGENVVCTTDDGANGTYSITVPHTALLGATSMRIRIKYNGSNCGSPCGTTTWGEVEDYQIVVTPATNTWIGNNSNWHDANNWTEGYIPTTSYNANIPIVPPGGNLPVIQSGNTAICKELIISENTQIRVEGILIVGD